MNKNTAVTKTDVKTAPKVAKKGATPKVTKKGAKETKHTGHRTYPLTARITVLVKENPKREGTKAHKWFELYKGCKTVADYLNAGGTTGCIIWDVKHGFIKITE